MNNIDIKYFGHVIKNTGNTRTNYYLLTKQSLGELKNSINSFEDSKIKTIYQFENESELFPAFVNDLLKKLDAGTIDEPTFLGAVNDPKPRV